MHITPVQATPFSMPWLAIENRDPATLFNLLVPGTAWSFEYAAKITFQDFATELIAQH
jgi:hypothetical protein